MTKDEITPLLNKVVIIVKGKTRIVGILLEIGAGYTARNNTDSITFKLEAVTSFTNKEEVLTEIVLK